MALAVEELRAREREKGSHEGARERDKTEEMTKIRPLYTLGRLSMLQEQQ